MRITKEEQVLKNAKDTTAELITLYENGLAVTEYVKLSNEYRRLSKRYKKLIKLSDKISHNLITENDQLTDNIEYTISKARRKILASISESSKTKKAFQDNQNQIYGMEKEINILKEENISLKERLNISTAENI